MSRAGARATPGGCCGRSGGRSRDVQGGAGQRAGIDWGPGGDPGGRRLVPECAHTRLSPAATAAPSTKAANTSTTTGAGSRACGAGAGDSGRTALPGKPLGSPVGSTTLRLGSGLRCPPHPLLDPRDPPAEDCCALTGGQPWHSHHDGLRQCVQVGAVSTRAVIAATAGARARLVLRQTLQGKGHQRRECQGPGSTDWAAGRSKCPALCCNQGSHH